MKIKPIAKVNPVAKHSRNKSGAGAHPSDKDYDRKKKDKNEMTQDEIDNWFWYNDSSPDSKQELIDLLRKRQKHTVGATEWMRLEEEIQELEAGRPILSVADLKDMTKNK